LEAVKIERLLDSSGKEKNIVVFIDFNY
jgi:hypothetical protein